MIDPAEGDPSLLDLLGGVENIHRLEEVFYDKALQDPVLREVFTTRQPRHVDHLTTFTAESFGGEDQFTRQLGFAYLIDVHRGLRITEEQRLRFVELYREAIDESALTDDPQVLDAVVAHVEFGSQVAKQNSHATTDDELHPLREVPRWTIERS
jgi:hemoglobin